MNSTGASNNASDKALEILIVDDQQCMVHVYDMLLRRHLRDISTYLFWTKDAGREAIKAIEGGYMPDLAILDVRINGVNGVDVCRALRSRNPEIPVLFLTSVAEDQADYAAAVELVGVDKVIQKDRVDFYRNILGSFSILKPYLRCGAACLLNPSGDRTACWISRSEHES